MQTGLQSNMPEARYREHDALARSDLDKIRKSPRYFYHHRGVGIPDTEALAFGRTLHKLLLEPETFWNEAITWQGAVRRGKAWDEFEVEHANKTILTQKETFLYRQISESFAAKSFIPRILKDANVELSAFWTDERTNVQCKGRFDLLNDGVIYDLKTSSSAAPETFAESAYRYGYHRQAAWYLDGLSAIEGREHNAFAFIVVEKEPPYDVQLFMADSDFIAKGREENRANLSLYAECLRTNTWPGYSEEIQTLSLPPHLRKQA